MLLIKKRYPNRNLYIYGALAFFGSFALVTALLSTLIKQNHSIALTPTDQLGSSTITANSVSDSPQSQAPSPQGSSQPTEKPWSVKPRTTTPQPIQPTPNTTTPSSTVLQPVEQLIMPVETPQLPAPVVPSAPVTEPSTDETGLLEGTVEPLIPSNP